MLYTFVLHTSTKNDIIIVIIIKNIFRAVWSTPHVSLQFKPYSQIGIESIHFILSKELNFNVCVYLNNSLTPLYAFTKSLKNVYQLKLK